MSEITTVLMGEAEARAITNQIKDNLTSTRALLLEMHERDGWRALGYTSWREYGQAEFGYSESRVYQLMDAAQIERNISTIVEKHAHIPESHIRPLTGLPPEQQAEAWQQAVDTAPNGKLTAAHVESVVRSMKPKANQAGDIYVPQGYDACQTPPEALDPLLPYLAQFYRVWEPACGEGYLVGALFDAGFRDEQVIATDIIHGENFFDFEPGQWDCIVTNPPYSIKYPWLERCYKMRKPFALLLPVETLGTKSAQTWFKPFGLEVIFFDRRINFKMPNIGWEGSAAQFPTAWFTWGLNIGQQITFAELSND